MRRRGCRGFLSCRGLNVRILRRQGVLHLHRHQRRFSKNIGAARLVYREGRDRGWSLPLLGGAWLRPVRTTIKSTAGENTRHNTM